MSYFRRHDIELQKTRDQQIKVRDYQEKLNLAQGELPGKEKKVREQLTQTQDYMRKVAKFRAREKAQHGDIDRQVRGQEAKILESARKLEEQARKARIHIGKFRHAAFERKKHVLYTYRLAVDKWWKDALEGLEDSLSANRKAISDYRHNASMLMQIALMVTDEKPRRASSKVWLNQYNFKWKDWLEVRGQRQAKIIPVEFPGRKSIDDAGKYIARINKADREQEGKIAKHERTLLDASRKLKGRAKAAHAKVDKALKERDKQFANGRDREGKLLEHLKYLAKRMAELDSEQDRMGGAQGDLAKRRASLLRSRAALAARIRQARQNTLSRVRKFVNDTRQGKRAAPPRMGPDMAKWLQSNHPLVYENYLRAADAQLRARGKK